MCLCVFLAFAIAFNCTLIARSSCNLFSNNEKEENAEKEKNICRQERAEKHLITFEREGDREGDRQTERERASHGYIGTKSNRGGM